MARLLWSVFSVLLGIATAMATVLSSRTHKEDDSLLRSDDFAGATNTEVTAETLGARIRRYEQLVIQSPTNYEYVAELGHALMLQGFGLLEQRTEMTTREAMETL